MVCEAFREADSVIHRLDPRLRVVTALVFSVFVAVLGNASAAGLGLLFAVGVAVAAHLPAGATLKRLLALNAFVLLLVAILPLSVPGEAAFRIGPLTASRAGLAQAALIALKANAILLAGTALLSTLELPDLGHALHHLKVPDKLTHLLLFTVRYVEVLHHEYLRLVRALKVRGFRPRMDRHTYRTTGYLVGMLLVRSVERSERILAAMRCRAWRGRFYVLDHFHLAARDAWFAVGVVAALGGLSYLAWGATWAP